MGIGQGIFKWLPYLEARRPVTKALSERVAVDTLLNPWPVLWLLKATEQHGQHGFQCCFPESRLGRSWGLGILAGLCPLVRPKDTITTSPRFPEIIWWDHTRALFLSAWAQPGSLGTWSSPKLGRPVLYNLLLLLVK